VDYLVNRARTFVFSTAPVPAAAAAASEGLRFVRSRQGAERCQRLWERVRQVSGQGSEWRQPRTVPEAEGSPGGGSAKQTAQNQAAGASAILPIMVGDEGAAVGAAAALRDRSIFIPAIRYPTVARGTARLRLTVTATHRPEDVRELLAALAEQGLSVTVSSRPAQKHATTGQA